MNRYAIVNISTGLVKNTTLWDGGKSWTPPTGYEAVQSDTANIGDTYANGTFTAPAPIVPTPPLAQAQTDQIALIRASFNAASLTPVPDNSGLIWSGGESSGSAIYLACQLAQQNGLANVTLWDSSNTAHTMTVAQGMAVAAAIGAEYQTLYQKWQTLRAQIMAATTVTEVQAITW